MTPVRTPDVVRGDVPGLMILGTPCSIPGEPWCVCTSDEDEGVTKIAWNDGAYDYFKPSDHECWINWSFPLAISAALHWLADRGHICTWMLPATHGGRVEAWSGLTAWEVSAILVARSVLRVARGLGPVRDLLGAMIETTQPSDPRNYRWFVRLSLSGRGYQQPVFGDQHAPHDTVVALTILPIGGGKHIAHARYGGHSAQTPTHAPPFFDPECSFNDLSAAFKHADRAALADGCALLAPGGILLPD